MLWGAWTGTQIDGGQPPYDMAAQDEFETQSGKRAGIIHWAPGPIINQPFQGALYDAVHARGSTPFVGCNSMATANTTLKLSTITGGAYDTEITAWADAAGAKNYQILLRHNQEMNGGWFPWSDNKNGNQPGDYVREWRHVHDIVKASAPNVKMIWCPNVDPGATLQPIAQYYPGDAYVDIIGLDGYNWGSWRKSGWKSFSGVFKRSYDLLRNDYPTKPLMICEVGCCEQGGSKAAWIHDMLVNQLPGYFSHFAGVSYFNLTGQLSGQTILWYVESSATAQKAWHDGISGSSHYRAGGTSLI